MRVFRCAAVLVVSMLAASCGRLGFDESSALTADAAPVDGAATDGAPGLGQFCDDTLPSPCLPGLACVLDTCSCLAQVKSDEFQTCSLTPQGVVACAGGNTNGELGNGMVGADDPTPAVVMGIPDAVEVELGAFHACARSRLGELWCWGRIDVEAATGTPYSLSTPEPVSEIAAGGFHSCVLGADQVVSCIGRNLEGQLGLGMATTTETTLQPVPGLSGVSAIASGGFHSCAIVAGGQVVCWGRNGDGQIGDTTTGTDRPAPTPVVGVTGVEQIGAGDFHTCARRGDGSVLCWGRNVDGQLGRGTATPNEATAAEVSMLAGARDLYVGDDNVCAIDATGTAQCWGSNTDGQLGFPGTTAFESAPMPFPTTNPVIDIAIGRRHTCALQSDGVVLCSGQNVRGELGNGTQTSTTEPLPSLLSCAP